MSTPSTTPDPQQNTETKSSLAEFIKANSTLVTAIAAFVALTAFLMQVDDPTVKFFFPAASFVGAVLLAVELWRQMPRPWMRSWRLDRFSEVLFFLLIGMGYYWLVKFRSLWLPVLLFSTAAALINLTNMLIGASVPIAVRFVSKQVFRHELTTSSIDRLTRYSPLGIAVIIVVLLLWGVPRLEKRLPPAKSNVQSVQPTK